MPALRTLAVCAILPAVAAVARPLLALAQPDPSGIDLVTVGLPNNPAYHGPDPENLVTGRGSVPYEFRIGRTEVTTAQWAEFYSAFYTRVPNGTIPLPTFWGAVQTADGRFVPASPATANWPVAGISWRTAARYVNWLHNNKSLDLSAMNDGAYDVTTFGFDADGNFTDQPAHRPGARFWIPTLDEYLKASFWSPDNPNLDGWYLYPLGRDTPPIYGPPPGFPGGDPLHEANAGFAIGQTQHWTIPLMSYPHATSPWGLMDVSGSTSEWLEEILFAPAVGRFRALDGSEAGSSIGNASDRVNLYVADFPTRRFFYGLRVAAAIPSCGPIVVLVPCLLVIGRRGRRSTESRSHHAPHSDLGRDHGPACRTPCSG